MVGVRLLRLILLVIWIRVSVSPLSLPTQTMFLITTCSWSNWRTSYRRMIWLLVFQEVAVLKMWWRQLSMPMNVMWLRLEFVSLVGEDWERLPESLWWSTAMICKRLKMHISWYFIAQCSGLKELILLIFRITLILNLFSSIVPSISFTEQLYKSLIANERLCENDLVAIYCVAPAILVFPTSRPG